jgi:isoquinoline 1-oxidoreductase subunit alpha
MQISLNVNGRLHQVDVDPEMPLLWVLRDVLGLTGTKYGCGISVCRACTVLKDGEPLKSCDIKASEVKGGRITTIEGLSADGSHPLQKAWIAEQVPQCGWCQSGMLMTCAALTAKNRNPSDEQIDAQVTNICVCGTYNRVRSAIYRAAGS